ncbi:hypothetical protein NDU88_000633 [Pleurodeles waltl]|uniref:Uncharacterized protein n=1 Tax=Pleurodeles waltl TaxID=8319 RepID=A0AAV7V687_PLEWA|nr:hypothetical protein NDU88_000633 [Pleurodeles waltl]
MGDKWSVITRELEPSVHLSGPGRLHGCPLARWVTGGAWLYGSLSRPCISRALAAPRLLLGTMGGGWSVITRELEPAVHRSGPGRAPRLHLGTMGDGWSVITRELEPSVHLLGPGSSAAAPWHDG